MAERKRYAIVGLGGRHEMFRNALVKDFKDTGCLVALSDRNPGRLALSRQRAIADGGGMLPAIRRTVLRRWCASAGWTP